MRTRLDRCLLTSLPTFEEEDMADSTEAGGWERTAKDLFAGAVGGIAQVLLGMLCMIPLLYRVLFKLCTTQKENNGCDIKCKDSVHRFFK